MQGGVQRSRHATGVRPAVGQTALIRPSSTVDKRYVAGSRPPKSLELSVAQSKHRGRSPSISVCEKASESAMGLFSRWFCC